MLRISHRAATVCIVVALTAGAARTAAAQDKRVSLYAMGGYYIASDIYAGTGGNTNKLKVDDSPTYGGRLVYAVQRQFDVEVSYARAQSDITSVGVGLASPITSVTLDQIDISGLYQGYSGPKRGYVSLGLGTTGFTPHTTTTTGSAQWRFAWNVGVGFMIDTGPSLTWRLDGRYRGTNTNRTTGSGSYCDGFGNCYGYASMVYWSGEVSAGLGVRF